MILTITHLIMQRACEVQVERFSTMFNNTVDVTDEVCAKHFRNFDWDWAMDNLLNDHTRRIAAVELRAIYGEYFTGARKLRERYTVTEMLTTYMTAEQFEFTSSQMIDTRKRKLAALFAKHFQANPIQMIKEYNEQNSKAEATMSTLKL